MLTAPRPLDRPDPGPPALLVIPAWIRQAMVDHARSAQPNESVGLLATVRHASGIVATAWFPGTNVDASPERYTMDRTEVDAALGRMSRAGWTLGMIVHSHPDDPAVPSATDRREHRYPDALMGIISLASGQPELRVWLVGSGGGQRLVEIPVRTEEWPTIDEEHW